MACGISLLGMFAIVKQEFCEIMVEMRFVSFEVLVKKLLSGIQAIRTSGR